MKLSLIEEKKKFYIEKIEDVFVESEFLQWSEENQFWCDSCKSWQDEPICICYAR